MDATTVFCLALSDIHGKNINKIPALPGLAEADAVLFAGDLAKFNNDEAKSALRHLCDNAKKFFAIPGNCDDMQVESYMDGYGANIHRKICELAPGLMIMGLGGSTPSGFFTPREYREEDYALWLEQMYRQIPKKSKIMLLSHNPPFNTRTDVIGTGKHVGGIAVREFIERIQPDICICGHLHESKAVDRLGRTVIVNIGAFMDGNYAHITMREEAFEVEMKTLN